MTPDRPRSAGYGVGVLLRVVFDEWAHVQRTNPERRERQRRWRVIERALDRVCRSLAAQQGRQTRRNRELLAEFNRINRRIRRGRP